MFIQNIISNKFDLNWSTWFSYSFLKIVTKAHNMKIIEIIMQLKLSMQELISAVIATYWYGEIFLAIYDFAMPGVNLTNRYHITGIV
jgi:hypothetical protein